MLYPPNEKQPTIKLFFIQSITNKLIDIIIMYIVYIVFMGIFLYGPPGTGNICVPCVVFALSSSDLASSIAVIGRESTRLVKQMFEIVWASKSSIVVVDVIDSL
jgi:SpoVK/Ycf46/Vps4 family AAA+-type ATPase